MSGREFKGGAESDREFEAANDRGKSDGKASIERQVERPGAIVLDMTLN